MNMQCQDGQLMNDGIFLIHMLWYKKWLKNNLIYLVKIKIYQMKINKSKAEHPDEKRKERITAADDGHKNT